MLGASASTFLRLRKRYEEDGRYRLALWLPERRPDHLGEAGGDQKIKTMKRLAYGLRDQEFFRLRIMGIHESKYAQAG